MDKFYIKHENPRRYEHLWPSNFYIESDGTTVEHEFQAAKTLNLKWKIQILTAPTPGEAKQLGRRAPLREDWEKIKVGVMYDLLIRKFLDHPDLAEALLATGDARLIEGNDWNDTFWGVCNGKGKNNLGICLMDVRDAIRESI